MGQVRRPGHSYSVHFNEIHIGSFHRYQVDCRWLDVEHLPAALAANSASRRMLECLQDRIDCVVLVCGKDLALCCGEWRNSTALPQTGGLPKQAVPRKGGSCQRRRAPRAQISLRAAELTVANHRFRIRPASIDGLRRPQLMSLQAVGLATALAVTMSSVKGGLNVQRFPDLCVNQSLANVALGIDRER
ncbi:hypothetical protein VTN96DRAFT_7061 [Rasamsonia emersonii]